MPFQYIPLHDPQLRVSREGDHIKVWSGLYEDIYFSSENGYAETMEVYVQPTELPERMARGGTLSIAELGFGTGLNFCASLAQFRQLAPANSRLYYFATEHAPLLAKDIGQILAIYPQIKNEVNDLILNLPPRWPGRHRITFDQGRVVLDLVYGDTHSSLAGADFLANAWFLDGFSPSCNPAMWQEDIFAHMARCSANDAICASFTAAGHVRRGLEKAGFMITRHDGFGNKSHRITGHIKTNKASSAIAAKVLVVGAGIAGASLAYALRQRGISVEVLESGAGSASGASGNIAAIQAPRLTVDATEDGWLSLNAFAYARRSALGMGAGLDHGVLALAHDDREAKRYRKIACLDLPPSLVTPCDASEASDLAGIALSQKGFFHPLAGAVDPRRWVEALMQDIPIRYGVTITEIHETLSGIRLRDDKGAEYIADAVVLAAGAGLTQLWGKRLEPMLPLTGNAGQVSHLFPPSEHKFSLPLSYGGYLARSGDGRLALGASYERLEGEKQGMVPSVNRFGHLENHQRLPKPLQSLLPCKPEDWQGRVSIRATTPDRLPVAGAVSTSVYVLGGLGSRGMITAPLLAEAIATDICAEASPLDAAMRRAVDPFRFSRRAGF